MQQYQYCEHFQNLKLVKSIEVLEESACRYCMAGKGYLWLCLTRNCGTFVCDKQSYQHMRKHLDDSKARKGFHCIFINVQTTRILCLHCKMEILDLDQLNCKSTAGMQDPMKYRLKILPALALLDLQKNKLMGQLENSEGHRKANKALTGFFGTRNNHSINSALQFLMQFQFFRDIVLSFNAKKSPHLALQKIFEQAQAAEYRAISTDGLVNCLFQEKPSLRGYTRKDPFEHVLYFLNSIHQQIKYYSKDKDCSELDEWDFLGKSGMTSLVNLNCPIFDAISFTLSLNYECRQCQENTATPVHLNLLKLNFPTKKRKAKEVEKSLAEHRVPSPIKQRRSSLINLFLAQEPCPFTLQELIIQFLKKPYHKEKHCPTCKSAYSKKKIHFSHLPEYLMIQINRMNCDGNSLDETKLQFSTEPLDMGPFGPNKQQTALYEFETAICLEKGFLYPVVAKSSYNKQLYIFRNEIVTLLRTEKNPSNPYILCYKRKITEQRGQKYMDCYRNVRSNAEVTSEEEQSEEIVTLPDFWMSQLKFGILRPLKHQLVCKHNHRKPKVKSRMRHAHKIPKEVYQCLLEQFPGSEYINQECEWCQRQMSDLEMRKKEERARVIELEKISTKACCMISTSWITRWMNFTYKKGEYAYLAKGYPFPGSIENKLLIEGGKCKNNLKKGQDYKLVNIFIWRLLKDLYGGGPEIRYKWENKAPLTQEEEEILKEVRMMSKRIKDLFQINIPDSAKKSMIIQKTTSFVESFRGSDDQPQLPEFPREEQDN